MLTRVFKRARVRDTNLSHWHRNTLQTATTAKWQKTRGSLDLIPPIWSAKLAPFHLLTISLESIITFSYNLAHSNPFLVRKLIFEAKKDSIHPHLPAPSR